jgi:hypothetical protein
MSRGWPDRVRGIDGEDDGPAIRTSRTARSRANSENHPIATPRPSTVVFCAHRHIHRTQLP